MANPRATCGVTLPFQHTGKGTSMAPGSCPPSTQEDLPSSCLPLPILAKNIPSKGRLPPPSGLLRLTGCFRVHQWGCVSSWASQDGKRDRIAIAEAPTPQTHAEQQPLSVCSRFQSPQRMPEVRRY